MTKNDFLKMVTRSRQVNVCVWGTSYNLVIFEITKKTAISRADEIITAGVKVEFGNTELIKDVLYIEGIDK